MWWFAAAHANLLAGYQALSKRTQAQDAVRNAPMLDAGCGRVGFQLIKH